MKLVKINKIPAYYIGKVGNNILIDVINIHPFEYPYELYSNIIWISEKITTDKINVYLNFSKQYGYLKVHMLQFDKKESNFDFSSDKEISYKELPKEIKEKLSKFTESRAVKA